MASGDILAILNPEAINYLGSNDPSPDIVDGMSVIDMALNDEIAFRIALPKDVDLTLEHHYAMSSATSDDVKLESSFARVEDGSDTTSLTFATAQDTGDVTVPGTAGNKDTLTSTHTTAQIDGAQKGEEVIIKIKRVAVTGTDASGDLEYRQLVISET